MVLFEAAFVVFFLFLKFEIEMIPAVRTLLQTMMPSSNIFLWLLEIVWDSVADYRFNEMKQDSLKKQATEAKFVSLFPAAEIKTQLV